MRSLAEVWPRQSSRSGPDRTAFVLSAGAAMGALQVGMLRALIEHRIHPDLIVGCSVGAINGMVLAGGSTLETVGRIQDVWMDLIDRELVPTGLLPSPVQLVRKGESISTNDALLELLTEIAPASDFAGLGIEFQCVATDIDTAGEHWFSSGDLVPAVLASASIPAVFPPLEIDGVRYLDGGIVDHVPVQRAVDEGATRIFVLQVGGVDRPRPDLRRPIDVAMLAYWLARRHRLLEDLARVPEDVEVVVLPHGNPPPVRFNDLSSSAHLMDVAYRASNAHLEALVAGEVAPTYGPITEDPAGDAHTSPDTDDDPEMERARRLFAAAKAAIGLGGRSDATGSDHDAGVLERAASHGPAMRALVDRVLQRSGRAPTDDHPAEK